MRRDKHMKITTNKGYTLLFAVIVSVLVLSIAAFILSVSRKQAILSSSARDSIYAFYAADSGLECAIENLSNWSNPANSVPSSITCAGQSQAVGGDSAKATGTSTFWMKTNGDYSLSSQNQSGISSCASTSVAWVQTSPGQPAQMAADGVTVIKAAVPPTYQIVVETRGYNIGWNGTSSSLTGPRKVERALRYIQG